MLLNLILLACYTALLPMLSICKNKETLEKAAATNATTLSSAGHVRPPPYKVGYVGCWSTNIVCDMIKPEEIDTSTYTNLIFAFVGINSQFQIDFMREGDSEYLRRLVAHVKENNPEIKVSVSLGGRSFNDKPISMTYFSPMISSPENRAKFVTSVVAFIEEYELSGIDFDWEDPHSKSFEQQKAGAEELAALATVLDETPDHEKEAAMKTFSTINPSWTGAASRTDDDTIDEVANFALLLQEVRAAFHNNYQISVVFPEGNSFWFSSVNLVLVSPLVDFMTLLALEYRGVWLDTDTDVESMMPRIGLEEIMDCVTILSGVGIPKDKIILALPFYGHGFISRGLYIKGTPYDTYAKIMTDLSNPALRDKITYTEDDASRTTIANLSEYYGHSAWVTFQTPESFLFYVGVTIENGYGGVAGMFIDMDDKNRSLSLAIKSGYEHRGI